MTEQKSVRLPAELVRFIDNLEGKNFNQKLVDVLYEFVEGEEDRQIQLENYDRMLEERIKKLSQINSQLTDANTLLHSLRSFLQLAPDILDRYKEQPEDAANR